MKTPHTHTQTNLNVTIDTMSRRFRLMLSDGSDGEDMFERNGSSHTSLATSIGAILIVLSCPNGYSLNIASIQSVVFSVSSSTRCSSESELKSDCTDSVSLMSSDVLVFSAESIDVIRCEKPFFMELSPELRSFENEDESVVELRPVFGCDCTGMCCGCWGIGVVTLVVPTVRAVTTTDEEEGVSTEATPDVEEVVGMLCICTLCLERERARGGFKHRVSTCDGQDSKCAR